MTTAVFIPAKDPNTIPSRPIASRLHTVGLLVILALITYAGIRSHGSTSGHEVPQHLLRLYAGVMLGEWALVFYVWRGILRRRISLAEVIGVEWPSGPALARGVLITIAFWFIWEGSARLLHLLLGTSDLSNVQAMLPRTLLEIGAWCLLSCTAGFCEEVIYRGYLQRQFAAWTGSAAAAVVLQAIIFGISHGYQGLKQVAIISVLGILYGLLAHWRRSLLPGMAAHAWSDIYGGWLHP